MDTVVLIKVISSLSYPIGLSLMCLLVAILLGWFGHSKLRRLALVASLLVIVFFSNPRVAHFLAKNLEKQYPQIELHDIARHDAIIVLGGGLRIPLSPAKHTQIGFGSDRYWYATQLFRAGKADRIILSGGNVYEQTGFKGEAYYAAQLLQSWGVPSSAIIFESNSRTTEQNSVFSLSVIQQEKIQSALLVTSAIHMPRAYEIFNKFPIPITPATADVLIREQYSPVIFSWIPSAGALSLSTRAMHEYYGIWFNELKALMSKT